MKLTIDIGNTQIKFGIFDKLELVNSIYYNGNDDIYKILKSIKKHHFSQSIISSVVPELTLQYKKAVFEVFNIDSLIINNKNCKINLNVPHPETVGSDRICNVAAALKLYNIPAIIIDFGTATTYDVINKEGNFIGGVIAPGVKTSAEYLIKKAALLSDTELAFPEKVIGKNTNENIQSGIMYGAVDQLKGMINRINNETNIKNFKNCFFIL